jgi:hypothetical protein
MQAERVLYNAIALILALQIFEVGTGSLDPVAWSIETLPKLPASG